MAMLSNKLFSWNICDNLNEKAPIPGCSILVEKASALQPASFPTRIQATAQKGRKGGALERKAHFFLKIYNFTKTEWITL